MADNIPTVTDGNFEAEVLTASASQPVLVDFWAEWCRPCHMLAPTVAEIAHDYTGKLKVMKLNVDEAMNSAGKYRVQGIPTLLLFKNVGGHIYQGKEIGNTHFGEYLCIKRGDNDGIAKKVKCLLGNGSLFFIGWAMSCLRKTRELKHCDPLLR